MNIPPVSIEHVSKTFTLRGEETLLTKLVAHVSRTHLPCKFTALNDVSFSLSEGEVLGVIGNNGSGKSTLLRILAGIYPPTKGRVCVRGRVVPLINLQVGLQQKLTMRDNIYLVGSLFGIVGEEMSKKFPSIVEFSELHDFVDVHMFQFSSGMQMRVAFSIAAHLDPEVLLLDEVFMAGDSAFKKKSGDKMEQLIRGDCTVVMVSHQQDLITKVCDRVLWLEEGVVLMEGDPEHVARQYFM